MEQIPATHLAYLAGFLDGEGCICLVKQARKISLIVTATNKDVRPLLVFRETFGGCLYWKSRSTPDECVHWHINGHNAGKVLLALFDHLIVKREQAEVALAFFGAVEDEERQETLRQRMRALNAKGRMRPENDLHRPPLVYHGKS